MKRIAVWSIVLFGILKSSRHLSAGDRSSQLRGAQELSSAPPVDGTADAASHSDAKANSTRRSAKDVCSAALEPFRLFGSQHRSLTAAMIMISLLALGAELVWFQMFKSDWIASHEFNYG